MRRLYALCALVVSLALVAAAPFPVRPAWLLTSNLVAHWRLEEASGTRLDELSGCGGSGCDLTDNNTVTQAAGKLSQAADFTAANSEFLSRADHADLSFADTAWSGAAWFRADSLPAGAGTFAVVASKINTAAVREWTLRYSQATGQIALFISDAAGATIGSVNGGAISAGNWYFVVWYVDGPGNSIGISVNGASYSTNALTGNMADTAAVLRIGATNTTAASFWDGQIDSVSLWGRLLSQTEVGYLYNSGNGCEYNFAACEATPTPTATFTPSNTPIPPTATFTPSDTPIPPTATFTPSDTPIPPTATFTPSDTPIPPTATFTPSNTPIPPTATFTPSNTPIPPTETPTLTPEPTACPMTATPTGATATASPPWQQDITLPGCNSLLWKRQWTFGQLFQGLSVLSLGGVLGLRWLRALPKGPA